VENLNQLFQQIRADNRIQSLIECLEGEELQRIRLKGLAGSQFSLLLAAIYGQLMGKPFLLIATEKEEAAYLLNDLEQLMPDAGVLFFPDSYKRPGEYSTLNRNQMLERTEAINKFQSKTTRHKIIISYPEALFEKTVHPIALMKNKIEVSVGEKLDTDFMIELMVDFGFDRVDFVYEPGQFSVRGGIIDIFSFGNEWPYRIELFDVEVESIRTFDPLSQLSRSKLSYVSIIPNVNTQYKASEKVYLTEILPENTCVFIANPQSMTDSLLTAFEQWQLSLQPHDNEGQHPESEEAYMRSQNAMVMPGELVRAIHRFHLVFYGIESAFPDSFEPAGQVFQFSGQPQPSYNRNFKLLIDEWKRFKLQGLRVFLFTDNKRQIERFYTIFEDLEAEATFHPVLSSVHEGFIDKDWKIAIYTDHQIFERYHRYKLRKGFTKDQSISLKLLYELKPGDFVTHIDHGVGRFSGLEKLNINGNIQESVRLIYKDNDVLYVSIQSLHKISRFSSQEGKIPKINKLGSEAWSNMKDRAKKKVKDIAKELIKLYAKRKSVSGYAFPPDNYMQNELEASFIYEDTPDQLQATIDVKEDMMKPHPMDRLICGDVGFGKTEVAVRAAFKAVLGGKQVAILVPTTILALQHYKTFHGRLNEFGVKVDYVNRFKTSAQKNAIYEESKKGAIDILIGTHAILNKNVGFKDLGLLVIDEEQKFGVAAKEKLRKMTVHVDTLTLTATPIPRTLQFSLMAARDLSVIRTAPPNRQPIHTEIRTFSDGLIKDAIYYEVDRGGQVFFVHNRVQSLPDITAFIQRLCPDVDIVMAHGQMESGSLERTLVDFIDRKFDVLVCTNIIETGLDIPNANTMIINNANQFGMSDLHQLRGRVGRSNRKAYCYLFAPPLSSLTREARLRLKALEEFSDLGSGYQIAMRDLDLRGAGNLLGAEQSGFIADIGFDTFQKILDEAIQEIKEDEFKELFAEELSKKKSYVRDVNIETDIEMHLPDHYVSNIQERLSLYTEMDNLENEEVLEAFRLKLIDRFGPLPESAEMLFKMLRIRWLCKKLGIEQLIYKQKKLRGIFIQNPQSSFYETEIFKTILEEVPRIGNRNIRFSKTPRAFQLVYEHCPGIDAAFQFLQQLAVRAGVENISLPQSVSQS
jgi:transcription-repair coupling factor (superfamily II helicase)